MSLTKLACLDKDLIYELHKLSDFTQRKALLIMLEKRNLEADRAVYSDVFISKLTGYKKWLFKKWTGLDVSLDMLTTKRICSPEDDIDELIKTLRSLNFGKDR